jgi:benzoate transport
MDDARELKATCDPRQLIDQSPMHWLQLLGVAVLCGLNGLDGFDVLSISFASPGIVHDWHISPSALGFVLSMELIGMTIGSIALGDLADRIGRRPVMLGCLVLMASGMWMAAHTSTVASLSIWRVFTGLGIGGMLATTNAMTSEISNERYRSQCVALMVVGYPIGAVVGGTIATMLLKTESWRSVFILGSVMSFAFLPIVWFTLPESVSYLSRKRSERALTRINSTLRRYGHAPVPALAPASLSDTVSKIGLVTLFNENLRARTVLISLAYFTHLTTFYFILKWIPKIVVDMGYAPTMAGSVLVWANVGGALGGTLFGVVSRRVSLFTLSVVALLLSFVMVTVFGHGASNLQQISILAAATGFFTNSGVVGLYAVIAKIFPVEARASGTGFAIGVGRGGSAIAPIIAGLLFTQGYGLQVVAVTMASGSLVAAAAILLLNRQITQARLAD